MPDTRSHRGPNPKDAHLFADDALPALRQAGADLVWLLDRGYAEPSSLKLVGDRHGLTQRQRLAVLRWVCTSAQRDARRASEVGHEALPGASVAIDGYNVLITIEAALARGVLLLGRDGSLRDMASLHGSFRRVEETEPALEHLGAALATWDVARADWYLDRPVSNSGRLRALMLDVASRHGWPWEVHVVPDPDGVLRTSEAIVASADSVVLDHCGRWFNLGRAVVARAVPDARILDLRASR